MRDPVRRSGAAEEAESEAARWALRCAEGLTAAEELALADWLAADPCHARLLAEYRSAWDRLEPLAVAAGDPSDDAATRVPPAAGSARFRRLALPALAAAAIALGMWWRPSAEPAAPERVARGVAAVLPGPCERRVLADGTTVELNRGAAIEVEFTTAERRVRLAHGDARFAVAKEPGRPFVVAAGAVEARAVGTEFNVRRDHTAVEIVVTEGSVQVESPQAGAAAPREAVLLSAGQQVVVAGEAALAGAGVRTLSADELEKRLAWQSRLIEFDDVPLAEIVAAFNRRNPVRLVIDDPGLAARRMTATFRSDNVESFVRLLEGNYGVDARLGEAGTIHLVRR